jgi:putative transposase
MVFMGAGVEAGRGDPPLQRREMGMGVRTRVNTIRIPGRDYAQAGAYFVTACTHQRLPLFGRIEDGRMILNEYGRCVQAAWDALPERFAHVDLDEFVIMPDHVHGIITLTSRAIPHEALNVPRSPRPNNFVGAGSPRPAPTPVPKFLPAVGHHEPNANSAAEPLGQVIGHFKYAATRSINALRVYGRAPVFQRGYYERIIRDDSQWRYIGWYIQRNPEKFQAHAR